MMGRARPNGLGLPRPWAGIGGYMDAEEQTWGRTQRN